MIDEIRPDEDTRRRIVLNRLVAIVAIGALIVTALLWRSRQSERRHYLTVSAGIKLGHRHELAVVLSKVAAKHGLDLEVRDSNGSRADLNDVENGTLDLALIGGDVGHATPHVQQVATLVSEPLHLFATPDIVAEGLPGLKGKRISLGGNQTGTHSLALKVMEFGDLKPGRDFVEVDFNAPDIAALRKADRPDALFALSPLPWELGEKLVDEGYRLMEIPFGEALSLRDREIHDTMIPAFSYSVVPPVPEEPLHTVATPMLVIANQRVPKSAVVRLMETLYSPEFARLASLPPLDPKAVVAMHDFPIHPGANSYLRRDDPILNGQMIDSLENLRSFLVSGALSLFLLWRWYRGRQTLGYEPYYDAVSAVERESLELRSQGKLTPAESHRLWERLAAIKAEALQKYSTGSLNNQEQLGAFLAHVSDARTSLSTLAPAPISPEADDKKTPPTPVGIGGAA